MIKSMFEELDRKTYETYLEEHSFYLNLGIDIDEYKSQFKEASQSEDELKGINRKIHKNIWESVDPKNNVPFAAELDDLVRLHYLVVSRKVTTILEFGIGKSTVIFDHALQHNKLKHESYVVNNLRRSNPFECHSIDNSKKWIKQCQTSFKTENVTYHFSKCRMGSFNDRICTFYDAIPNVSPDLIYLDAPDQHSVLGDVGGVSTRHKDKMPMSGDILRMEHFLLPGTLIVIDGRTANARFLKANLQRNWAYDYDKNFDQHFFELDEEPLGRHNKKQLEFIRNK